MEKQIVKYNKIKWRKRLLISTATEGWIRYEWAHARYGQIIPVNWEASGFDLAFTAFGYSIDDAYNLITKRAIEMECEWLIIIEDDVLIPPDTFIKFSQYMDEGKEAVVSGLYYTKSNPAQPLLFRGRGNGVFHDWELGDKVRVDGLPMGCLLIHMSLVKWVWDNSEPYRMVDGTEARRAFITPKRIWLDPETGAYMRQEGTQDLFFYDRIVEEDILKKTGWDALAKEEYPFLCDTSIFCRHIDRHSGKQYPT